jgi:hypothetical protein
MALSELSLKELQELKAKLERLIARNPNHSRLEQVELEDVEGWIALRLKENREPVF